MLLSRKLFEGRGEVTISIYGAREAVKEIVPPYIEEWEVLSSKAVFGRC